MPDDDARLTDFTDGSDETNETTVDDADESDEQSETTIDDGDSLDEQGVASETTAETASTAAWTPGGAPCDACGGAADRRWHDGEVWVCADCMDW